MKPPAALKNCRKKLYLTSKSIKSGREPNRKQDKEFFEKYLSGLVGEVFGEELMDKTKPDFYMVNFLRDDVLDEEGALVEEAPKVMEMVGQALARKLMAIEGRLSVSDRNNKVAPFEGAAPRRAEEAPY